MSGGCMLEGRLDEVVVALAMEGAVADTDVTDMAFGLLTNANEGNIS